MPHLTQDESDAIRLFKERLHAEFSGQIQEVLLFGSKARGDDRSDSDIDVLVVLSRHADWEARGRVSRIATDVLLSTNVLLSPTVYSSEQVAGMRRRNSAFLQSVERDAVPL